MALTSEDAEVIALYTAESPICYMLNGMLSQMQCPEGDRDCIAPLTKRLLNAVRRLGQPYQGRGFRALYADAPPLLAAFNDYATHFAVGASVNIFQFLSFTTNPEHIQHFIKHNRSVILLKCDDLIGYDIDALSFQTLCGGPREQEVLVLPPAYFTVKSHPYKVNNIVHVDLVYHAKISQDGSYVAQCAPDSRDTQNTSSLNSSLSVDFLGASNAALSARDPTEGDVNTDTLHPDPVDTLTLLRSAPTRCRTTFTI
ncbi:unnamed protein product [Bodo saltans]|uniref:Mono(ADP-ribosyl)transferase n=1 Tax=Bodo saltans TaxID=75058 RepID=A0A0S4IM60_BODSA|nr:unnamed protein product [Bodo saltans]|eukprot:CUE72147.1 unnamed protein product [Bodo saltans]